MKIRIPLLAFLFSMAAYGCSDHSTGTEPEEPVDPISGIYSLSGQQINLRYCYLGAPDSCIDGEVVARDTIETSYEVEITVVEEKTDTLFITGLEGLDVDIQNYSLSDFSGRAAFSECKVDYDCPYVKLTGDTLEVNMIRPGGHYIGTGILDDGFIKLETHFKSRGVGVDYHLEGEKIEGA